MYLNIIINDSRKKYERRMFHQETSWVSEMTSRMDRNINTYNKMLLKDMAEDYIISMVENADKEQGIFACIVDTAFNLVSERYKDDYIAIDSLVLSPEDMALIRGKKSGETSMMVRERVMTVFVSSFPKNNPEYYILVGVSPYAFDFMFGLDRVAGILSIIIFIMLFLIYSILIDNEKKCE